MMWFREERRAAGNDSLERPVRTLDSARQIAMSPEPVQIAYSFVKEGVQASEQSVDFMRINNKPPRDRVPLTYFDMTCLRHRTSGA